jgi:hypothetical protein
MLPYLIPLRPDAQTNNSETTYTREFPHQLFYHLSVASALNSSLKSLSVLKEASTTSLPTSCNLGQVSKLPDFHLARLASAYSSSQTSALPHLFHILSSSF